MLFRSVDVCVHVCVHVCVLVCVCAHVCVCACVCACTCVSVHMCVCVLVCEGAEPIHHMVGMCDTTCLATVARHPWIVLVSVLLYFPLLTLHPGLCILSILVCVVCLCVWCVCGVCGVVWCGVVCLFMRETE